MTNKKLVWLPLILLVSIILGGCSVFEGEEKEAAARLDINKWPTPIPSPALAAPTPFIKVTLAPTATPTTPPSSETKPTAVPADNQAEVARVDLSQLLTQQGGLSLASRFPAVAVAFPKVENAVVRQGPGASYGSNGALERGELVGVLGIDSGRNWLYVLGTSQRRGWVSLDTVRVMGDLTKASVLPPDPVAAVLAEITGAAASSVTAAGAESGPAPTVADLKPVTSATTKSLLNVRQGPGPAYERLGTLSQGDTVSILATNKLQDWVLVSGTDSDYGWVYFENLTVEQPVPAAPIVLSATPDAAIPVGGIAPFVRIVGAEAAASDSGSSGNQAIPATAVSNPSPAAGSLTPLTTARISRADVALRRGPGPEFGLIDTLTADDTTVSILAQDKSGRWLLVQVQRFTADVGWMSVSDLNVASTVDQAPQVITAWVDSNEIPVQREPGIYTDQTGVLAINTLVRVLGLNKSRSWALVQPVGEEGLGWTQLRFLTVNGSPADLPEAPDLPLPAQNAESATEILVPPPIPPRPVAESEIVIQLASGGDVMVIKPDGSGLRRLTNGIDPVLSPDGQTVAFTRWVGETGSLWLIDIDGKTERQVLGFIKQAKGPEWSPDGSQIVLNFQQGGRLESNTACTDLTQSSPRRPPRGASDIRVGVDDKGEPELCWEIPPDVHWNLKVVNIADGSVDDLDGGTYAFRPAWDPSQPWRIISDGGRGLLAVSVDGDYRQPISDSAGDGSPVFSPDGRYLAITVGNQGGGSGYDIYRLNRDGSGRLRLTETPLWVPVQPDSDGKLWNNVAAAWSPDGSQLAFLTDRRGRWEIWIMNFDGSNQHPLFPDAINDQLPLSYNFVDERVMSWR